MEVDIGNKNLIKLYEKGSNPKYRFVDKNLYRKFLERVNRLVAANDINDLRNPPSNRFEKLVGYDNRFSIRLDKKHRLEFIIDFIDDSKTKGNVLIIDITKHYE